MSLNRTISDLIVKKIRIKRKSGSSWINVLSQKPRSSHYYRIEVDFGNKDGRITWPEEKYRKDNVDVRIVAMGFYHNDRYYRKTQIVFYKDNTYSTPVSGDKFRTRFLFNEYATTNADSRLYAYFRVTTDIPYTFKKLKWNNGVYGSVRNKHWKKKFTS